MGLYPSILFHFTTQAGLNGILENTFRVSYAREKIKGRTAEREFGIPMVSFCDLRLSELKEHIKNYGKFGIGLTKTWAFRNGLNPVMYASKDSHFTDDFISAVNSYYSEFLISEDSTGEQEKKYLKLMNTYRYLKNYEGELKRYKKKTIPNYRFADEREWRYVPSITENIQAFILISEIDTKAKKNKWNGKINHISLPFQPDDINYLIVEKESDINPLIRHLRRVKARFDRDTVERLSSRILTSDQIYNDV